MRTSTEVNMQEAEDIICSVGNKNAIHLEGRPGIGKTAMAENIAKRLDMRLLFMDGPNIDIAELGVPMPNHETGTSSMYPNERWGFHLGDPFLLFIDEFTKMARGAQNQVHPAINERRFGPFNFHPDVHVITTGNYSSDGVGDTLLAHTRNRMTVLEMRGPTAEEWLVNFAQKEVDGRSVIHPILQAFVDKYPSVLASYRDAGEEDNKYIINPTRPQQTGTTPRSLHKASNILWERSNFSDNALSCALEGTIGKAATGDLMGYIIAGDKIPDWQDIINDPEGTKMVEGAAGCILACSALQRVTPANFPKFFTYLKRGAKEMQALFCLSAKSHAKAKDVCNRSGTFVQWCVDNQYMWEATK